MSKAEDDAVITDIGSLINRQVEYRFSRYEKDRNDKDVAMHKRFDHLETLVTETNGGANIKMHAIIQDVIISIIAFFTIRNN